MSAVRVETRGQTVVTERTGNVWSLAGQIPPWWLPGWRFTTLDVQARAVPACALGLSLFTLGVGLAAVLLNAADELALPAVCGLALGLCLLLLHIWRRTGVIAPALLVLIGCCVLTVAVLGALPLFFSTLHLFAVIHRSVADALLLLILGVPSAAVSGYYLLGATPRASDIARYPLLLVPVVLGLGSYTLLAGVLISRGWQELQARAADGTSGWLVLVRAFHMRVTPPAVPQSGLLLNLLGTLELVVLTLAIAVPVGVCVGVFVSEIAPGPIGRVVRFCTTSLRGISVVLLALAGASFVAAFRGSPLDMFIGGFFVDSAGIERVGLTFSRGSYIPAALVTALLVIPVVARATEEGCRSLPRGIREGSAALGASSDYALVRLVLPWAFPNIVTATLLGAAETAGGVSTLLFLAGSGETGVSPFNEVSTLAFAVFWSQFSPFKPFRDLEQPYQFAAAALLLVIALTFTILSLVIKTRYAARYGGT